MRMPAYLWNSSDEIHEIQKTNYRIAARTGRPPPKNTRGKGGEATANEHGKQLFKVGQDTR